MIDCKLINYKHGKFEGIESVKRYATARYPRWEDYSKYHCTQAGIEYEATDVLNEVMLSLLEKDIYVLERLYSTRQGQYTQLDFYVLQMVKLNVHSVTSPYQSKYNQRLLPVNRDVNYQRLQVIDEPYNEFDRSAQVLKEMRLITWVLKGLDLTDSERRVFEHRFLHGNSLCSDWHYPETRKQRYRIYKEVETTIHHVLFFYGMTDIVPKGKLNDRQSELADRFVRTHRIKKNKQSNQLVNN